MYTVVDWREYIGKFFIAEKTRLVRLILIFFLYCSKL